MAPAASAAAAFGTALDGDGGSANEKAVVFGGEVFGDEVVVDESEAGCCCCC